MDIRLPVFRFIRCKCKKMCYTDKDCESDYENMEDKTFEFSSVNSI